MNKPFLRYCSDAVYLSSMSMLIGLLYLIGLAVVVFAHGDQSQKLIAGPHKSLWYNTLPGDGGTQVSSPCS